MDDEENTLPLRKRVETAASDKVTAFVGSWACIYLHTVWFLLWWLFHLDVNLLTLIVSLEAIYLMSAVMMSQNRAVEKDEVRDDQEASEVDLLTQINHEQLELLHDIHTIFYDKQSELDIEVSLERPKCDGRP